LRGAPPGGKMRSGRGEPMRRIAEKWLKQAANGLGGDLSPEEFREPEDAERCLVSAESVPRVAKSFLGP